MSDYQHQGEESRLNDRRDLKPDIIMIDKNEILGKIYVLMVKIRLRRSGRKNRPFYRIVVIDSRKARDGKYIESVGYYDPRDKKIFELNRDRINYWMSKGAQPTNTVSRLMRVLPAKPKGGSDEAVN